LYININPNTFPRAIEVASFLKKLPYPLTKKGLRSTDCQSSKSFPLVTIGAAQGKGGDGIESQQQELESYHNNSWSL
jgi:hypothetical protein